MQTYAFMTCDMYVEKKYVLCFSIAWRTLLFLFLSYENMSIFEHIICLYI